MAMCNRKTRAVVDPVIDPETALSTLNKRHFVVRLHGFLSGDERGKPVVGTDWGGFGINDRVGRPPTRVSPSR